MPESEKFTPKKFCTEYRENEQKLKLGFWGKVWCITFTRGICKKAVVVLRSGNIVAFDEIKSCFFQKGCISP